LKSSSFNPGPFYALEQLSRLQQLLHDATSLPPAKLLPEEDTAEEQQPPEQQGGVLHQGAAQQPQVKGPQQQAAARQQQATVLLPPVQQLPTPAVQAGAGSSPTRRSRLSKGISADGSSREGQAPEALASAVAMPALPAVAIPQRPVLHAGASQSVSPAVTPLRRSGRSPQHPAMVLVGSPRSPQRSESGSHVSTPAAGAAAAEAETVATAVASCVAAQTTAGVGPAAAVAGAALAGPTSAMPSAATATWAAATAVVGVEEALQQSASSSTLEEVVTASDGSTLVAPIGPTGAQADRLRLHSDGGSSTSSGGYESLPSGDGTIGDSGGGAGGTDDGSSGGGAAAGSVAGEGRCRPATFYQGSEAG
jgi:hypothetical protein